MTVSLYAALLGACIGSFLGVVIERLPSGQSVVRPRSRCPHCRHVLAWYHLVPVVSYAVLRGRCGFCRAPIARAGVFLEVATALLFAGIVQAYGVSGPAVRYAVLTALLLAAAEIDRRHGIIPNRLLVVGAVLGGVLAAGMPPEGVRASLGAALSAAGIVLVLRWASRRVWGRPGMGLGDVKLAGVLGLYLGWDALWVLYLAALGGGALGLAGLVTGRLQRTSHLPFAPFVAVGTLLYGAGLVPERLLPI